MLKRRMILATAFIASLTIVVWRMPAAWSLGMLSGSLPDLAWADARGNAWRGAASGVRWKGLHLGQVDWQFTGMGSWNDPGARWQLRGESPQYRLSAVLSPRLNGGAHISELHGSIPAAWVDISAAAPLTYLAGRLRIHLEHLTYSADGVHSALGDIRWEQAALTAIVNVTLGALTARLRPVREAEPDGVRVVLSTHDPGDVTVHGDGRILGPRIEFGLELKVAPDRPDLRRRLSPFGQTAEDGTIAIQLQEWMTP